MNWKRFFTTGNKRTRSRAFSLIEVIVSVALFAVIMLSATEIFKLVVDSQRNALASQNVQESLKYFLEVMGKEIRMAQVNRGVCPDVPLSSVFVVTSDALGDALHFKNYYGQCVVYYLAADGDGQRFKISRNGLADFISPAKIRIDDLHFVLDDSVDTQPVVTINLRAHAIDQAQFKSDMTIQTSLTSRFYKN